MSTAQAIGLGIFVLVVLDAVLILLWRKMMKRRQPDPETDPGLKRRP